jgi:hypothetical protein
MGDVFSEYGEFARGHRTMNTVQDGWAGSQDCRLNPGRVSTHVNVLQARRTQRTAPRPRRR